MKGSPVRVRASASFWERDSSAQRASSAWLATYVGRYWAIDERLPPLSEVALAASALVELRHGSRSIGLETVKRLLCHWVAVSKSDRGRMEAACCWTGPPPTRLESSPVAISVLGTTKRDPQASALLPLRVVRRAAEVNGHARLVTHRPRVMTRRDVSGVSGADLALRPILHHNLHPAR
jgi:hypothetical protein